MKNFKLNYYKIIGIVGIILSILWIVFVNTRPYSDFKYYNDLARQIANGGQWGDTYTSVGYSIVLGFVYKIFGSNLMMGKVFNIFLTFLNYLLVYKILKKISISERKRKLIYGVFVLFPNNIFYNSVTGTEILFTTVFFFITFIYYSDIKYKYIIIGILTAVDAMVKPFFILFFLVIFILELVLKNKWLTVIKHSMIILFISMLCISPWIYRNTKLVGEFTLISNNSGIVLYINNNSQNNYGRWMPAENVENSIVTKKDYIKANATEKNKMLTVAAKKWIITHPKQFFMLGFKRLCNTYLSSDDVNYSLYGTGLSSNAQIALNIYVNDIKCLVFILAIISIIIYTIKTICILISRKKTDSYSAYNLILFYMFTCVYFVTEGQARYSFPVILIAIFFAICLLEDGILFIKNKRN